MIIPRGNLFVGAKPVTDLSVKSVIAVPEVLGAAWSSSSPVSKVDVSTDGSQSLALSGTASSKWLAGVRR